MSEQLAKTVLKLLLQRPQERSAIKSYRARRYFGKAAVIANTEIFSGARLHKAAMLCQELERRGLEFERDVVTTIGIDGGGIGGVGVGWD